MLARERWLGEECAEGSYLAKDFEDSGDGLFLVELVDTDLDIAISRIAWKGTAFEELVPYRYRRRSCAGALLESLMVAQSTVRCALSHLHWQAFTKSR